MSSEISNPIKDLYQQVILEHNRYPKNFKEIPNPTHFFEGYNPLCGDHIKIYVNKNEEQITDISFIGQSCAICKASTSIMTESVKGKSVAYFEELFNIFHNLATGKDISPKKIGKLEIFSNISRYPTRVKCATLAWHTLRDGLMGKNQSTTEENLTKH